MGKSRAEIQKAYRQRLKEKNAEEYLRKERERMRRNNIPSQELSKNDRKLRNEKNRVKLRRFIQLKREERQRNSNVDLETSGYESAETSSSQDRGAFESAHGFSFKQKKRCFEAMEKRNVTSKCSNKAT
jgi:hypothetical protein